MSLKVPVFAALVTAAAFISGCKSPITNVTSQTMPENPSQIYTITTKVKPRDIRYDRSSMRVQIVIDGQIHDMRKSGFSEDIYEFDFPMPAGAREASYYVLLNYHVPGDSGSHLREYYSPLTKIQLTNRYVYTIEANRGPTGARIGVVGRGFTPQDVVYLDNTPARTLYESLNSVSFQVPAIPSGNYRVSLNSPAGNQMIGSFRVDGVSLSVAPSSLTLRRGQRASLLFSVSAPAPAGGLLVNVSTDVPRSIIMAEVIIPAGQMSVNIEVQGGEVGSGNLYVGAAGQGEISVPVSVTSR